MKLKVPFCKQRKYYNCLPVSLKMALKFFGYKITLSEIEDICGTDITGTDIDRAVDNLRDAGYRIEIKNLTLRELKTHLKGGMPVITIVNTYYFPWIKSFSSHAVVVIGFTENEVVVNDPLEGEKKCSYERFLHAWRLYNNLSIIVKPTR
ncbi:MAG TPA: hypothetical protein ENG12_04115 [Candidatus Altiarchaeales archaeon]|nr:hypothetical protein [Candidatus Altiarchaeales archaeon]